jgi:PAS domain S-box-containing protein
LARRRQIRWRNLEEFFLPEESWDECKGGLNKLIAGEVPHYSINMSVIRAAGELVWVNMVFSLVRDDVTYKLRSLTAVATDIAFLKRVEQQLRDAEVLRDNLRRRMMDAQEASRTNIARELHDDIGQSLAVLSHPRQSRARPGSLRVTHNP